MGKIKRKFDIQFKTQVCQAIEAGTARVIDICRDHQLQRPTVEGWLKSRRVGALTSGPTLREKALELENEKLKAKVGELVMTVDILKKMEIWKNRQKNVNSSIIISSNLDQFQKPAKS